MQPQSILQSILKFTSPYTAYLSAVYTKIRSFFSQQAKALLGRVMPLLCGPCEVDAGTERGFTAAELAQFNGRAGELSPIYVSLKRKVFHVPRHLYGPESPYSVFAGTDCSRNLAKNAISDDEANADYATLNEAEMATLDRWYEHFMGKYEIVGWFVPDEEYFARGLQFAEQDVPNLE